MVAISLFWDTNMAAVISRTHTLLIWTLDRIAYLLEVPPPVVGEEAESYQQLTVQVPQGGGMHSQQMRHSAHTYHLK